MSGLLLLAAVLAIVLLIAGVCGLGNEFSRHGFTPEVYIPIAMAIGFAALGLLAWYCFVHGW